jgi:disulfide bond formation protein DsbB
MKSLYRFPVAPFALVWVATLSLLASAVFMTQVLHLSPCPLCIIQQMLYLLLAILSSFGLAVARIKSARRIVALLMAAAAGTGVFVAAYQTRLQHNPSAGGCSGYQTWWEEFVDRAGELIPFFKASGICSDPAWKFLGFSLAEWSLVWFTFFLLVSLYALIRPR